MITKLPGMPARKNVKLPEIKERRLIRPDEEQLALLEKAIYHSFKMTFSLDSSQTSKVCYEGKAVITGVDLKDFFKLIVKTYATL